MRILLVSDVEEPALWDYYRPGSLSGIDLILTSYGDSFAENGFVGTVLSYRSTIKWDRYSIQDWGKWLLFGDGAPMEETNAALWVKGNYIFSSEE